MELLWWLIAIVLMAIGLIGTLLPVVPGAIVILAAAVLHQIMLGSEKSVGWWNISALALLTMLSYWVVVKKSVTLATPSSYLVFNVSN